jgi:hypothetical protein
MINTIHDSKMVNSGKKVRKAEEAVKKPSFTAKCKTHKKYVGDFHRVWNTEKHYVTESSLHNAQPPVEEPTNLGSQRGPSRQTII